MAQALRLFLAVALLSSFSCMAENFSDFTYHLKVSKPGVVEHGTAVAVHAEGFGHFILTANHCVKDTDTAELSNGTIVVTAKVVFRDVELDFAILKADVKTFAALATPELTVGSKLTFCHYPRGQGPLTTVGTVVKIAAGNVNYFAHSEGFYHGSSGCPVFVGKDTVAGIALSGLAMNGNMIEGEASFLPSKRIFQSMKAFLDTKAQAKRMADIVDMEEKF